MLSLSSWPCKFDQNCLLVRYYSRYYETKFSTMTGNFTSAKKPKSKKRKVELVVISDVHLGTYGCHAGELVNYMKSIKPKAVVLNGDIIDGWQFSKRYFP